MRGILFTMALKQQYYKPDLVSNKNGATAHAYQQSSCFSILTAIYDKPRLASAP